MARGDRAPKKFSFPLPRRSRPKNDDLDARPAPSIASGPDRPSRLEDTSSKAHRILGTSDVLHRTASRQSTIPPSPGFMSITVSEASFGSHIDERNTATPTENDGYLKRPTMATRASSNVLGRTYTGESRHGSDSSSLHRRLHPQTSNSTLRSHYDAKKSPLAISQQTSDSAVRDRALRRGYPPVLTDHGYDNHEASPVSPVILEETRKKEYRKSKPARLDLTKLFPKPKDGSDGHGGTLLSPAKMVNSPAAMSSTSEFFPRPMTRQPTPQVQPAKLQKKKSMKYHNPPVKPQPQSQPQPQMSPVRKVKRDQYDNAKIHVRRPPKGVQHWFDALDEDSEESEEEVRDLEDKRHNSVATEPDLVPDLVPTAIEAWQVRNASRCDSRSQNPTPAFKRDSFALEDIVDITHLTSPSQYSLDTYRSHTSAKTKTSAISKTNLQDSSVLSFSSSEDEADDRSRSRKGSVRKSMDSADYTGEIVIGRAQAYELPPHRRMQSSGKLSILSTSTNATIEVMYAPEPPFPSYHHPRGSTYSGGRLSSHVRQPSIIHEDDDIRPKTAVTQPISPTAHSVVSTRTSASAPQAQSEGSRKFMQVTPEEEALLELMRKKRAAMNKQIESSQSSTPEQDRHQHKSSKRPTPPHRTSASLAEDRNYSPVSRGRVSHQLLTPSVFSPQDMLSPPSPPLAASFASPTTTGHPSPLPSPMTPALYADERDVAVKVASSDTSNELDELAMLDHGIMRMPSVGAKSESSHRRRRTASSDAEITFPVPPTSTSFRDLTPVSEASSRAPSIVEPALPKMPKKNARHISELALASIETRSRQSSIRSTESRTSVYSQSSSYYKPASKGRARHLSPDANVTSSPRMTSNDRDRDSVSDDVLAAWGSLGGTY
ncbi:uncharacterized protein J4E87_006513 [Alternaria ethzedia]|uniref:uncharacterized protein n=1 Tax=Alternaria ethzedia TaxID=181014 RepID=UPI0020C3BDEF|nr:uncharacterized protein J4E87_006513 [Alternaria ethzedia]KAI4620101.1 hypothetical protein J4E80_004627 [Alternaria sp. BMP 0032]KAI4622571.1 hypothetical protein J4E87_006513 [Alternaria ethzedia]